MPERLKLAINTGGGDAPGLNAVIRAVVLGARYRGWDVYGVKSGYAGLLDTDEIIHLTPESVWGITAQGGTILGTTNRGNPFQMPVENAAGEMTIRDVSDKVVANFKRLGLDCLVAVGGDGSLSIAQKFFEKGLPVVGVPKTIDNDLSATMVTFGFDTAVSTATEAIDKLHSTAASHERVLVVEVMGRYAGWIALNSGVSGSADAILIPEIPFDIVAVCEKLMDNELRGRRYGIVVVAEGAAPKDGTMVTHGKGEIGREEVRLGGIGEIVAQQIARRTGKDTRSLVLGHLQRGGSPTTFDRLLATRYGAAAVRFIEAGQRGIMVAHQNGTMVPVELRQAVDRMKRVPLDHDTVITARELGISFGD
ncbi:MAG: ATP-dependent 6-phosphofructokinase [Myxococcales bacterium]|nr:MAG: ATP-dependent 6-phosphofructokinase [Myxococcales bacterium]